MVEKTPRSQRERSWLSQEDLENEKIRRRMSWMDNA